MKLVFLGTSCMVPTKERNHQSIFVSYKGEGLLFDCGEGTQRQLKLANIKPSNITRIFISHWHGDHVFGLPGLLQTLSASEFEETLNIYGPKGTRKKIKDILDVFPISINFSYNINEIKDKQKINLKDLIIKARELDHSIICFGFSIKQKDKRKIRLSVIKKLGIPHGPLLGDLQNNVKIRWKNKIVTPKQTTYIVKGKKLAIVLDTVTCKAAKDLASDADVLIADAVYTEDLIKKAEEYKHLTARQAAQLASQSNVKKLILTHFSQRYKTTEPLLNEAKLVFKNTLAAHDLMKVKV